MSVNYESDSTYCSVFESTDKKCSKIKRKSESAILDDIYKKIQDHVVKEQLLNPFQAIKYKQQISKMKLNSYKLKFCAEKIKTYLNGIYKQSKSVEDILLNNSDPLWDCGISQDLIMLNGYKNDLNPIALPAQTDTQSLSFDVNMLSNQLFITELSKNSANSVVNGGPSNATYVNLYDDSQNCELNIVSRKSKNSDLISADVRCTETLQKDHECVSDQSLVNISNFEETILINNAITENVGIEEINNIGSSSSFKSDMLSNQNFILESTKSCIHNTNASQDLFTQKEINFVATENDKTNNSTELLECNWLPTKALNQMNLELKKHSNNRLFNIVKQPTFKRSQPLNKKLPNISINSLSTETMSIDETETMSLDESLNIITSVNSSDCNKMDIDSTPCSDSSEYYIKETNPSDDLIFKKPFVIKRKSIISSSTQVPSSSHNSDIKLSTFHKSDKTDIGNFKPLVNECEELCKLTKNFLNIVEASEDDSKKTIEVLKNISNPSFKKEFQTVSQIGTACTEYFNKKINNLFYNIGSGSENWEDAAQKLDETNYLHQEISDWLQDILDNISSEDKTKTKEAFNSLENEVVNCFDPKDISDLDIKSLFHSNHRRLQEISNEFNRQLILDDFKSTTRNEERFTDLSYFDWKQLL